MINIINDHNKGIFLDHKIINKHIIEHQSVTKSLNDKCIVQVEIIAQVIVDRLKEGGAIFWCGNGGSASDSQHLAAELVGRYDKSRRSLKSISLVADNAAITCIANDFGYNEIFSRQIEGLGSRGDVLVGITTSGNSQNIIRAIEEAKSKGIITIGLLGKGGGKVQALCDHYVTIDSNTTARIQEMHILIGHILCDLIERGLGL